MLKTRVITALALLAILVPILFFGSFPLFILVSALFLAAATWESSRLFQYRRPLVGALVWSAAFALVVYGGNGSSALMLFGLCVAIWLFRLVPTLGLGLPALGGLGNRLLSGVYGIAILGCFTAMIVLFRQSPLHLLSVMAIVWIADIGAYFAGKTFGKRKLAPSISPGKSWEGAVGGWFLVMVVTAASALFPDLADTFAPRLLSQLGVLGFVAVMSLVVAASIVGDLFESSLKRRAGIKDSSNLLPGHGGVLDRIDALIPTLPLVVLIDSWL